MLVEVVLAVVLVVLVVQLVKRPHGLPPGRWGLPLVGYVPLTRKSLLQQLNDLHKQYGDIYMWRMGTQLMVYMHDYKLAKEAFSRAEFSDRPDWSFFTFSEPEALGIGGSNGARWHHNRRFSLRQLRDLGMGKSKLEGSVHDQAARIVKALGQQAGKPGPIPHELKMASVNVIWQMVGDRQFEPDAPVVKEFDDLVNQFFEASYRMVVLDFLPWLKTLLPNRLCRWLVKQDLVDLLKEKLFIYFMKVIDEHRATLDKDNPRDLIDSYLIDMDEKKNDPESTLSERDLVILLTDLFFAGADTTTNTNTFILYYLANHPEVQAKVQAEMDEVLGGENAALEHRSRLPYTEAMIHEVMRMSTLTPTGLEHAASKDTHLAGFTIPKGTVVAAAMESIHHDPRYWQDPHTFRPERWLDQEGKFDSKKEGFLPFSIGKRVCLGESLARMEILIFQSAILQNFSVAPPPGSSSVSLAPDPNFAPINFPKQQDLLFTARHH